MTTQRYDITDTLEQRVEERTHELSETNMRLVNEVEQRQKAEETLAAKAVEEASKTATIVPLETAELAAIVTFAKRYAIPLIAMTAESDSTLGREADVCLTMPSAPEACPNGWSCVRLP